MTDLNGNLELLRFRELCFAEPCFRKLCFHELPADGVKPDKPVIYEWRLNWNGKCSVYVGQSSDLRKRIEQHRSLVRRLLQGSPYNRRKPQHDYQPVHYALADATRKELRIELHLVANISEYWLRCAAEEMRIVLRRCQGWTVLNVGEHTAEKFELLKLLRSQQAITLP